METMKINIPQAINWQEGEMSVKNNVNSLQNRRSDENLFLPREVFNQLFCSASAMEKVNIV